jgi:imidazolonepropionase-like amidohydrolase
MITTITNGNLLDPVAGAIVGERTVVVEDDLIVDVAERPPRTSAAVNIDARGRFLLPGFVDAHVHFVVTTMNFPKLLRQSPLAHALGMAKLAEGMVARGFTTVRDTGGAVKDLVGAIEQGLCRGPRIIRSGRVLSQTGGHGDLRASDILPPACGCEMVTTMFGHVVDGADAVRKASRHEFREGSRFLKIMTSGGVASPTDPFDSVQYTPEEVRAATLEAAHRHTYVTAHAYTPEAIRLAVDNGVTCIEHGNVIDASTATHLAALGVPLVPTLVTYKALNDVGPEVGLPQRNLDKNQGVYELGLQSVEVARQAGVELGFGTDLLGEAQPYQNMEFAIRAELEPAVDVLRSMYVVNATLCGLQGKVGQVVPGAYADLLVSKVNPLERLSGLADPGGNIPIIMQNGQLVKQED